MSKHELHDQMVKDCKEIWKHMAITGKEKQQAIEYLYRRGRISRGDYVNSCPLCQIYFWEVGYEDCERCPWPGSSTIRCQRIEPYRSYYNSITEPPGRPTKKINSAVYQLVKTFK